MKFSLLVLCLFLFIFGFAQQFNFRSFSYEEGLNTYNIQKVIQDKYGYIWIATQDGLYRYNGKTFEAFRKLGNRTNSLRENFIFDIDYTGKDIIYVAEFNGGIDAINIVTLSISHLIDQRSPQQDGLPNLWIKKIYCDSDENLWIGGKDYLTIYNSRQKEFKHLLKVPGFDASVNVSFISAVSSNKIAVGVEGYGMLVYDQKTLQLITTLDNSVLARDTSLYRITDITQVKNHVYLSSNIGIIKGQFVNNAWKYLELISPAMIKNSIINCLAFDGDSNLWVGTNSGLGWLNVHTNGFTLLTTQRDKKRWLEDNTIHDIMIDMKNYLWISTTKVLQLLNLNQTPFKHFSGDGPGNARMDHIYSLASKSKDEVFSTGTDGLYITNLVTESTRRVKGSTSLGTVHYIMQISDKIWLVSSDEGMFAYLPEEEVLSQSYLLKLFPEWAPYIKNYFNTSLNLSGRIFWASEEQEGLLIWDTHQHTIRKYKANTSSSKGITENHIHNIKQDKKGDVWLLFDNSVAKYSVQKDSVEQIIPYKEGSGTFNSGIFFDMFDDGETLWFGTYGGGINGYNTKEKKWKYITEKDGLCNNCVYSILPEKDSVFWVSTNMGISRVNHITGKCDNYYFEDGLQDNSFDEKGALLKDDKMLFGGINGFTLLDPAYYDQNTVSFPVYIDKIEYFHNGQSTALNNLNWDKLRFPPKTSSITIHLSALYFSNNKKIKFNYKIKSNQEEVLEVGDDNKITLNPLDDNNYELVITYLNERGESVSNALRLNLFIEPVWYKTWWFRVLIIAGALGTIYGLYRFRIHQILKEQKMRRAIASDLHDDIGSTLNSAKMFTHLAIAESGKAEHLNMVKQNMEQALMSLRDLIWVLDDQLDTIWDLVNRLQRFTQPLTDALGISLQLNVQDEIRQKNLTKAEKRNLYLIGKEAINNSIKYARCKTITINISMQAFRLSLTIEDDGKGFKKEAEMDGYGLKNIVQRAAQVDFVATIHSLEGKGTKITLVSRLLK